MAERRPLVILPDGSYSELPSGDTLPGVGGSSGWTIVSVSSTPYTITPTTGNILYLVDATSGAITLNVPTAVGNTAVYAFKKTDASANTVIVDANSTETINGDSTAVIQYKNTAFQMVSDNANFNII